MPLSVATRSRWLERALSTSRPASVTRRMVSSSVATSAPSAKTAPWEKAEALTLRPMTPSSMVTPDSSTSLLPT